MVNYYVLILNLFNRRALDTTETELKLIAAAASIGFISGPPKRYKRPPAMGRPNVL